MTPQEQRAEEARRVILASGDRVLIERLLLLEAIAGGSRAPDGNKGKHRSNKDTETEAVIAGASAAHLLDMVMRGRDPQGSAMTTPEEAAPAPAKRTTDTDAGDFFELFSGF